MKPTIIPFLLISIFFWGCSSDGDSGEIIPEPEVGALYFPPSGSATWETLTPTELGWNTSAEQALYDLLEEKSTKAFIILKDGKMVVEWYFGKDSRHRDTYIH